MKKLTNLLMVLFSALDLLFGSLVAFSILHILAVEQKADGAWIFGGFLLLKIITCCSFIWWGLRTYETHDMLRGAEQDSLLQRADQELQRFPVFFSVVYVSTWMVMLGGGFAVMHLVGGDHFGLQSETTLAMVFALVAIAFGSFPLCFPLVILLTSQACGRYSVRARELGIVLGRSPTSLQTRIGVVALSLALGPTLWMTTAGYMAQAEVLRNGGLTDGHGFLISAGAFCVIVTFWAPICAAALSRAVSIPLENLAEAAREVVEEGNQTTIGVLPSTRRDEVGLLAERFNDLLEMMRDLSRGAESIARGNLDISLSRRGELPEAFSKMVTSLLQIVSQIRQSSVELASAATEILAASQEQESAATSQSTAMTEISRTMDSLSESAAHVSEAVSGVLGNAEQTMETTDSMVERIESLSGHTGRISELLDTIRDIADKSDLLALNGSLEASRAGEGGRGFALVAAEMRRLAVRVTASVEDVKSLIADIRESSSATIMATEESRRLARETTDAARQITMVSQQQRTGTEQVSQSVREAASVVSQAAAATSQTRTSAQSLKQQADLLSSLVQRFRVPKEIG